MTRGDGGYPLPEAIRAHKLVSIVVSLAVVAALAPTFVGPAAAGGTAPAELIPTNGLFFGAYVGPRAGETRPAAIQRVESQVGRTFAIDHQYERWDSTFPNAYETWSAQQGRIPFINWKPSKGGTPIPWSRIASGAEDDVIKARADAIKAFGKPMYLTFHHEPENDLSAFGTPQDFAAAYRHIVEVMRARGVTNVAFVWTMMAASFTGGTSAEAASFYPGDDVVDLIGSDGYNWYPAKAGTQWRSFQSIFQATQDFARAHEKPWMTVEYGVQEDPANPGRKAAWFRDALATAKSWAPSLKGLMYFDTTKLYPWDTDSSATSMAAYKAVGADPSTDLGLVAPPSPAPSPTTAPSPSPTKPPSPSPTTAPSPTPTSPPPTPTPAPIDGLWWNTLDGGPAGSDVTPERTSNTGTPFDQVVVERGASLTFHESDTGRMTAKHDVEKRENAYYQWSRSFGQHSLWYGRVSVKFDGLPSGDLRLIRSKDGHDLQFAIDVMHDGLVRVVDAKNQRIGITSTPILGNTWNRIEWMIDQRRGVIQVAVFTNEASSIPSATLTTGNWSNIGSSTSEVEIGRSGSQQFSEVFWTDDPAVSTTGWIGPA
jgi:Glycosyl hydrolase family 26